MASSYLLLKFTDERVQHIMGVKSKDSGVKLPQFEIQVALYIYLTFLVPQFPYF